MNSVFYTFEAAVAYMAQLVAPDEGEHYAVVPNASGDRFVVGCFFGSERLWVA